MKGNDRADKLAGKATLTSGLPLGRSEMLRSLRNCLRTQNQGHHTIDRLEEKGVEKGSARRSALEGTKEGQRDSNERLNCFKGNVGETSEIRGGAQKGSSERTDAVLN